MKKALVTGINGQDGAYFRSLLEKNSVRVTGISRSSAELVGSVADATLMEKVIREEKPSYIVHLAAVSSVNPAVAPANHDAIATGTFNILESCRLHSPHTRIFIPGSALQFQNTGEPISEETPFHADSVYAASRIYSAWLARHYRQQFGLKTYVGYFFHHDSPRRSVKHMTKYISSAALEAKAGTLSRFEVGDLNAQKEWNYAGDLVNASWLLMNQDTSFEAVLGCGETHSVKEWVGQCFSRLGMDWEKYWQPVPGFKPQFGRLVSNPATLRSLGWAPSVSFEQLADIMLGLSPEPSPLQTAV